MSDMLDLPGFSEGIAGPALLGNLGQERMPPIQPELH